MWSLVALSVTLVGNPPPGPCDLLDRAAVSALLGAPAPAGHPSGPEPDEDTGGTLSYCTYPAGAVAVVVTRTTYASAAEAAKATTKELVASHMDDEEKTSTVAEKSGLGDKAYWAYNDRGAEYVVLKGADVVAVALGGRVPKPPASYEGALRTAAAAAAAKL